MTTFDHWREWKERCAMAECGAEARAALTAFARHRWVKYLRSYGGENSPEQSELSGHDIWHRFETWCWSARMTSGKAYKDWLFQRLETLNGSPLEVVESGATLLLRDIVRDYLRHEGRSRRPGTRLPDRSLDDKVPGASETVTFRDLLPGAVEVDNDLVFREYQRLGREEAEILFAGLEERERIVLTARGLGLPLSDAEVERIAGRKKSVLCRILSDVEAALVRHIDAKYADEDQSGRRMLAAVTLMELMPICQEPRNSSETWRVELFKLGEDRVL